MENFTNESGEREDRKVDLRTSQAYFSSKVDEERDERANKKRANARETNEDRVPKTPNASAANEVSDNNDNNTKKSEKISEAKNETTGEQTIGGEKMTLEAEHEAKTEENADESPQAEEEMSSEGENADPSADVNLEAKVKKVMALFRDMQREFKPKEDPLMPLELEIAVVEVEKWTREEKNTETSFKVMNAPSTNGVMVKQTRGGLEICEECGGEQKCFLDGSIVTTIKNDTEMEGKWVRIESTTEAPVCSKFCIKQKALALKLMHVEKMKRDLENVTE